MQEHARQSNCAIPCMIGVSEATIRRWIRFMVVDGTLAMRAVHNPAKFGLNTSAVIEIDA